MELWGSAIPSNINRIQTFQSKCLRLIIKPLYYVTYHTIHNDFSIPLVQNVVSIHYKRFHARLKNHSNSHIIYLSTSNIPGEPVRHLKSKWCRDLLDV